MEANDLEDLEMDLNVPVLSSFSSGSCDVLGSLFPNRKTPFMNRSVNHMSIGFRGDLIVNSSQNYKTTCEKQILYPTTKIRTMEYQYFTIDIKAPNTDVQSVLFILFYSFILSS